jgi:hypothetical protein
LTIGNRIRISIEKVAVGNNVQGSANGV